MKTKPQMIEPSPAARLCFIIVDQSDICLSSSCLVFGGRYDGLVLLMTFSKVLGPTERVGLCFGAGAFGALAARGEEDVDGMGGIDGNVGVDAGADVERLAASFSCVGDGVREGLLMETGSLDTGESRGSSSLSSTISTRVAGDLDTSMWTEGYESW